MIRLNLPTFEIKLSGTKEHPRIFDILRRRYVALTPEEWVRQHFVMFLINYRNYPSALIANETSISLNGMSRRCDSVVFRSSLEPLVIVEYKAPHVTITKKTFMQAHCYNQVLRVPYIIITNGLTHYCYHIDYTAMSMKFLNDIPFYKDLIV